MNNFAKELQEKIDQARQWAALSIVGKAVDIFVAELKQDLLEQANRGIEIKDMGYVVSGRTFDKVWAAFHTANKGQCYPSDQQIKKFNARLGVNLLEEGLKFEFYKNERTETTTMRFTIYAKDI